MSWKQIHTIEKSWMQLNNVSMQSFSDKTADSGTFIAYINLLAAGVVDISTTQGAQNI